MADENVHQIRCPVCGGRLFDVITDNGEKNVDLHLSVMIKCWKCRKTIKLNNIDYLVQASHAYNKIG